jgi:hypothetical protein
VEDLIHHCLEGHGAVCQTKVHHKGSKYAMVHVESCLPFVTLLDVDIVVSPADVQLHKLSCSLKAVDQVIYKGEWVPILVGYHVEHAIVLYEVELPSFFLMKKTSAPIGDLDGWMQPVERASSRNTSSSPCLSSPV